MRSRIVLCVGIVLCLVGTLDAADTYWKGPGKWDNPANWTDGVPAADVRALFTTEEVCILDVEAETQSFNASGEGRLKVVDGGHLTVYAWSAMSQNKGAGYLEVSNGGVVDFQNVLSVGFNGEGHLTVDNGGTVNISNRLDVANRPAASGFVDLEGGILNLFNGPPNVGGGTASINFQGGTLTFPDTPANQDSFNTAIGAGIVKAYEGYGQVVMDPNETPGVITVRGVHPLNPSPRDGAVVGPGTVELSWMLPDPVVPGQPVLVNVYFTDDYDALWNFTDPAAIRVVSMQNVSSVVVQAQPKTRYYWAVDTYIGSGSDPVLGPIFTFTADNKPPVVVAAEDVVAWLTDGVAVVNLAGSSVTDDGAISPYTVLWTVVSEPDDPNSPDAVIANPRTKDTSITLSAVGEYVLQLEAFDGEYTGSDTVTINVFSDSCEAAKSLPDYELLPGDLNGDCVVNDLDRVILQDHWLECNALDCTDQGL